MSTKPLTNKEREPFRESLEEVMDVGGVIILAPTKGQALEVGMTVSVRGDVRIGLIAIKSAFDEIFKKMMKTLGVESVSETRRDSEGEIGSNLF